MCCHRLCIAIPLCGMLGNGDDTWFHVMYIIPQMLVQGQYNGSVNFVCFHSFISRFDNFTISLLQLAVYRLENSEIVKLSD